MKTYRFTVTVTTDRNLTHDDVHSALDELITDGQSVARQVVDDEEATDRSRLAAEDQLSLDLRLTPGNARADAIMRLLRDERDSWLQAARWLEETMRAPDLGIKDVFALRAGLDRAVDMRTYVARLITDLGELP